MLLAKKQLSKYADIFKKRAIEEDKKEKEENKDKPPEVVEPPRKKKKTVKFAENVKQCKEEDEDLEDVNELRKKETYKKVMECFAERGIILEDIEEEEKNRDDSEIIQDMENKGINPVDFFGCERTQYMPLDVIEEIKRQAANLNIVDRDITYDTENIFSLAIMMSFQSDLRGANNAFMNFERWACMYSEAFIKNSMIEDNMPEKIKVDCLTNVEKQPYKIEQSSYFYTLLAHKENVCRRIFRTRDDPYCRGRYEISEGLNPRYFKMLEQLTHTTRSVMHFGKRAFHTQFVHVFTNIDEVYKAIKDIYEECSDEDRITNISEGLDMLPEPEKEPSNESSERGASFNSAANLEEDAKLQMNLTIADDNRRYNERLVDIDYEHIIANTDYKPIVFNSDILKQHTTMLADEKIALKAYPAAEYSSILCIFRKFRDAIDMVNKYTLNEFIDKKNTPSKAPSNDVYATLTMPPEAKVPFDGKAQQQLSNHILTYYVLGEQFDLIAHMCYLFFNNIYSGKWWIKDGVRRIKRGKNKKEERYTRADCARYRISQKIQWIEMYSTYYAGVSFIIAGHTASGIYFLDKVTPWFNEYFLSINPEIILLHHIELLYFALTHPPSYDIAKATRDMINIMIKHETDPIQMEKWVAFMERVGDELTKMREKQLDLLTKEKEFINTVRPIDHLDSRMPLSKSKKPTVYELCGLGSPDATNKLMKELNPHWEERVVKQGRRAYPEDFTVSDMDDILNGHAITKNKEIAIKK